MNNSKGFTLIELVMVIVILGILAAVAIPRFTDLSNSARQASAKGALGAVKSGVVAYLGQHQDYPNHTEFVAAGNIIDEGDFSIVSGATGSGTAVPADTSYTTGTGEAAFHIQGADFYVPIAYDSTDGSVQGPF